MANVIRDNQEFLRQARAGLADMKAAEQEAAALSSEVAALEKSVADETKAQADLIEKTIRTRRNELSANYDGEISKIRSLMKQESTKRHKAVSSGKKARSKMETGDLVVQEKELKKEMKEMFRTDRMPAFCNSKLYYSLYSPGSFSEILILLAAIVICFVVIPLAVYHFTPWEGPIYLTLVYVVDILVFGGLYILIWNLTRGRHPGAFKEGKSIRKDIRKVKKQAKRIERGIARDKDDSIYDTAEYDENLSKLKSDLDEVMARRSEAMTNFEEVTKQVIADEITDSGAAKLQDLQTRLDRAKYQLSDAQDESRRLSLGFTDTYGPYIDREFWNEEAIDGILAALDSGEAGSIIEAQSAYRSRKNSK